jgi:hypothetical protein
MEEFGTNIPQARRRVPLWKLHKALMDLYSAEGISPTAYELQDITEAFYAVVDRHMKQDMDDIGVLNRRLHDELRDLGD